MPFALKSAPSHSPRAAVPSKRLALLDALRGLLLCNMLLYHLCWDAVYLFDTDLPWYRGRGAYLWQQSICWGFLLLSGFCQPLGRRPLRRGVLTLLAAALIHAVTAPFGNHRISFGILTLLGSCTLLSLPLDKFLRRTRPAAGMLFCALLFFLTRNAASGALGFESWNLAPLPAALYQNGCTAYLGFPPPGFYSSDYFPLLPWSFLFFCGAFAGRSQTAHRFLENRSAAGPRALRFLGRHSLAVYLLHQPLLYALLRCALP